MKFTTTPKTTWIIKKGRAKLELTTKEVGWLLVRLIIENKLLVYHNENEFSGWDNMEVGMNGPSLAITISDQIGSTDENKEVGGKPALYQPNREEDGEGVASH